MRGLCFRSSTMSGFPVGQDVQDIAAPRGSYGDSSDVELRSLIMFPLSTLILRHLASGRA